MRGEHKGFEGKVTGINRKTYQVFVDGVRREKVNGTSISVPIHPSKVMITRLNLDDRQRREMLNRKGAGEKSGTKSTSKPSQNQQVRTKKSIPTPKSGGT
jgi:ribosomal protein L24